MAQGVVFIHGLWLHSSSWQNWIDLFTEQGYDAVAPGYPNEPATVEAARANPDVVADFGLDAITEHYARIVDGFDTQPILIGHSVGGVVVEKLLGQGYGAAGVAISPAQIKGVLPTPIAQLRAGLPIMANPANVSKALSLNYDQFRYAFANAVSEEEAHELFDAWSIPSPVRPLFETALVDFQLHSQAKVDTDNENRGPLLLIGGGQDNTEPTAITDATMKQYRDSNAITVEMKFDDRGHSMTVDSGWNEVATEVLQWVRQMAIVA